MRHVLAFLSVVFLALGAFGQGHIAPLPNATGPVQPDSFALIADPATTDWTTDLIASAASGPATVNSTNCCFPGQVSIPSGSVRIFANLGASISVPGQFTLLDIGPTTAEAFVIARHKAGMRITLPMLTTPLTTFGQEQTAFGLVNSFAGPDADATRVWVYQSGGVHSGQLTFSVRDENGHEVAGELWPTVPDRLRTFRLARALPAGGSVVVTSGCVTAGFGFPGCNDPSSAPDGQTFVFFTVGPETGMSAPRVVVPH